MNTTFELTDAEVLKAFNRAMDEINGVTEAKRTARRRRAKADFCNMFNEGCGFIASK